MKAIYWSVATLGRLQKKEMAMTQTQQIENHREPSERRIVAPGGSSRTGLAVAQQVARQGATAIIASGNADRVKQAVAMLDAKAEGHSLDLSNERGFRDLFQKIADFFRSLGLHRKNPRVKIEQYRLVLFENTASKEYDGDEIFTFSYLCTRFQSEAAAKQILDEVKRNGIVDRQCESPLGSKERVAVFRI
jgi:NAD(P)-dependent dehydrogenase (short-subunit alcohol dehydrogenase family)